MTDATDTLNGQPDAGPSGVDHYTEAHREMIADRTGELLENAFAAAERHIKAQPVAIPDPRDDTRAHFVITSAGVQALPADSFDQYRVKPLRRTGRSCHERIESFIDVTNRFKGANTVVYAQTDPDAPGLATVFDYHPANDDVTDADNLGHTAKYSCPLSPEWKAWFSLNDKWMAMGDFAAFLEDRIVDVLDSPGDLNAEAAAFVARTGGNFASPSKLIELSRGLQVYENSVIKEARNLSTGEVQFTFDATHTDADGKPLSIPSLFIIAIPVFERSAVLDRVIARLRYRKRGDGITFSYDLWRPDLVFTNAFEDVVAKVRDETHVPVFYGKPEA